MTNIGKKVVDVDFILKIGGSVITDKRSSRIFYYERIDKIATILKTFYDKGLKFALVTGVGNVGHRAVAQCGAHKGDDGSLQRRVGLVKAQIAVNELRNTVLKALAKVKIPAFQFYTSSITIANQMQIHAFNFDSILEFMKRNIVPVTSGDIVADQTMGYSVMSGDLALQQIAFQIKPKLIAYGTNVAGIYSDDPLVNKNTTLLQNIQLEQLDSVLTAVTQSTNIDVSGAMKGKFDAIKSILQKLPDSKVHIFDLSNPQNLVKLLTKQEFEHTIIST